MDIERINYLADKYKSESSQKRKNKIILEIWEAYHPKIIASTRSMGVPQGDVKNEFFLYLKNSLDWWQPNSGLKLTTALQYGFFKFYRQLKGESKRRWVTLDENIDKSLHIYSDTRSSLREAQTLSLGFNAKVNGERHPKHTERLLPITTCIAFLSPADRDVIRMRYERGLSLEQISRKTRVTSAAVHYRIKKAEKRLKEIYIKKKSFFN